MPRPDAPPLTRGVVLRGFGFAAAVALSAVAVWLIVTSTTQKSIQIGILTGLWGLMLGALSMFGARRTTAGDDVADDENSSGGVGLALRGSAGVDRAADAAARRDFEDRLAALIEREVSATFNREVSELRSEIAQLRQDLVDKVGGQLRLERIETTRLIGSDLEALQHEVRKLKVANEGSSVSELLGGSTDQRVTAVRQVVDSADLRPVGRTDGQFEADVRPAAPRAMPKRTSSTVPDHQPKLENREEQVTQAKQRAEAKRVEAQREEATQRAEAKRVEDARRAEAQRVEAKQRAEAKRAAVQREEAKQRSDAKRAEAEAASAKRAHELRAEADRVAATRAEAQRVEADRVAAKRAEAEAAAAKRADAQRLETQRAEAKRAEAAAAAVKRSEAQHAETQRVEAQRAEAKRVAAEAAEALRFEAQRVAAQAAEAQQVAAQVAEAQRVAKQAETERAETERAAEHAKAAADPFASLPRIRPFTDFPLDPTPPNTGPAYAGRRRRDSETDAADESTAAQGHGSAEAHGFADPEVPDDAAAGSGRHGSGVEDENTSQRGRRRRAEERDAGGELLAKLLAREAAER